jgi:phage-related tail fiber protein
MATTTPNFGWPVPTSTDLVKDGATAIEALGDGVDASMVDLKGGTTGQILAKATNADMDFAWITNDVGDITAITASSPLTGGGTSGAITVGIQDASTSQKGAVQLSDSTSTTSSVLAATPTAVKAAFDLANEGGPAFRAYRATTNQSFSQNTWTKVQLNAESYDTASCFDSTTNYRFTPNKAGYYQLNCSIWEERSGTGLIYAGIWKNGAEAAINAINTASTTHTTMVSDLIYFNGSTDYVEMWIFDQAVTSRAVLGVAGTASWLSGTWIRS